MQKDSQNSGSAHSIEGHYGLFVQNFLPNPGKVNNDLMGEMIISDAKNSEFSIRGLAQDWSGRGVFENSRGYYEWEFPNGDKGRTELELRSDGFLYGHVKGHNNPIDWHYVGVPINISTIPEKCEKSDVCI